MGWRVTMHDYTRRFLVHVNAQGWQPIGCQVACGSLRSKIATAVDVVCVDMRNDERVVLVELKCGFERYLDRYGSHMLPPFENMTDCPRNQFQVQLLITRKLFLNTYRSCKHVKCVVVRVTRSGVDQYRLDDTFKVCAKKAWSMITDHAGAASTKPAVAPANTRRVPKERQSQPCALVEMKWKKITQ
jgi:hypothetical protein